MSSVKKISFVVSLLALASLWLAACGGVQPLSPTAPTSAPATPALATPTLAGVITPDASMAIPNVGSATVRQFQGMIALRLHSQPDTKSPVTGQVKPGDKAKVVGTNAEGTWVLLQFEEQSGWVPIPTVDLIMAQ